MNHSKTIVAQLRRDVLSPRHKGAFVRAQTRKALIAECSSVLDILAMFENRTVAYELKDELARELIEEYQQTSDQLWSSLLLLAFYPMLIRVIASMTDDGDQPDEIDQQVICDFFEVARRVDTKSTNYKLCMFLRVQTKFAAISRYRRDKLQRERLALMEPAGIDLSEQTGWPEARGKLRGYAPSEENRPHIEEMLRQLAKGVIPDEMIELIVQTKIRGVSLTRLTKREFPDATSDQLRRTYDSLKHRRASALRKLKDHFFKNGASPLAVSPNFS